MNTEYTVEGMTCNHCKANVERVVSQIAGIESAEAIPSENKLIVKGSASTDDIRKAVESLGYIFKENLIN